MLFRSTYQEMRSEFYRILKKLDFTDEKAGKCAEIFTVNSLEGVYSHGVNRFGRFVKNIMDGYIYPDAEPSLIKSTGSLEQWDGHLGPGPLNAVFATDRTMTIAAGNGIGLVGLANTNHWMRGGTYGWQAARKGFIFIGWTNTCANMPAWGARDPRIGNNPFVIAVPFMDEAIVLDFAMTQYSYGKLETYRNEGLELPFPGGFNSHGDLTRVPGEILKTFRALPIGYWKGSGLALLLDILAAVLSGGFATCEVPDCKQENRLSQVFIAIDITKLQNFPAIENTIGMIISDLKKSIPENENDGIRYPGESVVKTRRINLENGIPVNTEIWKAILKL